MASAAATATAEAEAEQEEQTEEVSLTPEQKRAVAATARAFSTYGEARKTMAKVAKAIVNLRLAFEKEGRPDFRGETPQYRGAIADLYEAAIHDPDERASFKVAIRYWVGKEFAARVANGSLQADALEAAGIVQAIAPTSPRPTTPQEPRRARTVAEDTPTGIVAGGHELSPPEVLVAAERIVSEHIGDEALGAVMALQSVARTLGPIVAGLRDEDVRAKQPGRALRSSTEQVLTLALDSAMLAGVEIEEFIASWYAENASAVEENKTVAA